MDANAIVIDPQVPRGGGDVQTLIDQADEAVRQANEAGRSLVLPEL